MLNNKILLLILTLGLFKPVICNAATYFADDFGGSDFLSNWELNDIFGETSVSNLYSNDGELNLINIPYTSRHLYGKNTFGLCDYVIESQSTNNRGLDLSYIFRISNNLKNFYMVDFRFHDPNYSAEYGNNFRLWKYISTSDVHRESDYHLLAETSPSKVGSEDLILGRNLNIRIEVLNNRIVVKEDSVVIFDYIDSSENYLQCGGAGLRTWGGNFGTYNKISDYRVVSFVNNTSESDKKYIILPGLGASWNLEAMVYDREVDDEDWTMTPFVKSYHGIVDLFESNDLDYDVWNYDWRKPLVEIVGDFEEYISKNTDDNDEIYVVGHSLGGLVARLWQQKNNDDRVGKVISIGSPHLGALRAYEAYNGAKLTDGFGLDSVMWNLYLTLIDKGGLETAENIREMVPILKDLSPVYDFLEKNGRMIPSSETFYNNYFLTDWNNEHQESNNLWLFSGFGVITGKELRLEERNIFEKILNIWPDGRPISTVYSDGDGTVISQSSAADFGEVEYFGGKHSDLVNVSLSRIAEILGLNNLVTREEENDYEGRLFFIGSPAEMKVSCEGMDEKDDELGFVFVSSDESEGECEVQIMGTDSGTYHFVGGNIKENKWFYSENEINNGEIVEFTFDSEINGGESGLNRSFLKQQILRDINILKSRGIKADYKKIIKLLERLQLENLVDEILEIRQRSGEVDLTKRMVENCVRLSPGRHQNSKSAWNKNIKKIIEAYIKIAEKKALIDELKGGDIKRLRAENYLWMRQIMEEINDDNFQNHLRFRVVNRLFTGI